LIGKPVGKKPLGIPTHRRENNIKMGLKDIGYEAVDGVRVTLYRYR
jgi:hypothetical protein